MREQGNNLQSLVLKTEILGSSSYPTASEEVSTFGAQPTGVTSSAQKSASLSGIGRTDKRSLSNLKFKKIKRKNVEVEANAVPAGETMVAPPAAEGISPTKKPKVELEPAIAAPLLQGQGNVPERENPPPMVGENEGVDHAQLLAKMLNMSVAGEAPEAPPKADKPPKSRQKKPRKNAKKSKVDAEAGKEKKEKSKAPKATRAKKITTRVVTRKKATPLTVGEPRWTLTKKQPLVPLENRASSTSGDELLKPKIWCGSKEELLAAQPELAKSINGITWSLSSTPVVFLDDQAEMVVSGLAVDGISFEVVMARDFACLSADLALPDVKVGESLRLRGGAASPTDDRASYDSGHFYNKHPERFRDRRSDNGSIYPDRHVKHNPYPPRYPQSHIPNYRRFNSPRYFDKHVTHDSYSGRPPWTNPNRNHTNYFPHNHRGYAAHGPPAAGPSSLHNSRGPNTASIPHDSNKHVTVNPYAPGPLPWDMPEDQPMNSFSGPSDNRFASTSHTRQPSSSNNNSKYFHSYPFTGYDQQKVPPRGPRAERTNWQSAQCNRSQREYSNLPFVTTPFVGEFAPSRPRGPYDAPSWEDCEPQLPVLERKPKVYEYMDQPIESHDRYTHPVPFQSSSSRLEPITAATKPEGTSTPDLPSLRNEMISLDGDARLSSHSGDMKNTLVGAPPSINNCARTASPDFPSLVYDDHFEGSSMDSSRIQADSGACDASSSTKGRLCASPYLEDGELEDGEDWPTDARSQIADGPGISSDPPTSTPDFRLPSETYDRAPDVPFLELPFIDMIPFEQNEFQEMPVPQMPESPAEPKPNESIPSQIPPEIEIVCSSYVAGTPVIFVASRSFLAQQWGLSLPEECGMSYLGFFKITAVQEQRLAASELPQVLEENCVYGSVEWRFTCQWIPDGEDAAQCAPSGCRPRPWWAPNLPSVLCGPGVPPKSAFEASTHTSQHYLVRRMQHPNYPLRDEPLYKRFYRILPLYLLAPPADGRMDSNIPSGWFCSRCGRVNVQDYLRHRTCRSSFCQRGKAKQKVASGDDGYQNGDEGYAVPLQQLRDPQQASPSSHPYNTYPQGIVHGMVEEWEDGMQAFIYSWEVRNKVVQKRRETDGNVTKLTHVFTGNTVWLQHEAGELLREFQMRVPLHRKMGSASPYFTYVAGVGPPGSVVPWEEVPGCVIAAKDLIISRISVYAEMTIAINRLSIFACVTSGTRKATEALVATRYPVALMVLGCELSVTFVPKSGFQDPTNPNDGSVPEMDRDGDAFMGDHAPLVGTDANTANPDGDAMLITEDGVQDSPRKGSKRSIMTTLLHGDIVMLSGDTFEYSVKRSGTSILLVGSNVE